MPCPAIVLGNRRNDSRGPSAPLRVNARRTPQNAALPVGIGRKRVAQEIDKVAMIGEDVRLRRRRGRRRGTRIAPIIDVGRGTGWRGNRSGRVMNVRDESTLCATGMIGYNFRGLDFDAMHRPLRGALRGAKAGGVVAIGIVARICASVTAAVLSSACLDFGKSGFGLARRFECLSRDGIDVVPPANEWHVASGKNVSGDW